MKPQQPIATAGTGIYYYPKSLRINHHHHQAGPKMIILPNDPYISRLFLATEQKRPTDSNLMTFNQFVDCLCVVHWTDSKSLNFKNKVSKRSKRQRLESTLNSTANQRLFFLSAKYYATEKALDYAQSIIHHHYHLI